MDGSPQNQNKTKKKKIKKIKEKRIKHLTQGTLQPRIGEQSGHIEQGYCRRGKVKESE